MPPHLHRKIVIWRVYKLRGINKRLNVVTIVVYIIFPQNNISILNLKLKTRPVLNLKLARNTAVAGERVWSFSGSESVPPADYNSGKFGSVCRN